MTAGSISDEQQRSSSTEELPSTTAVNKETEIIKSTDKGKRVKLERQSSDFPAKKRLKQQDRIEDFDNERYSIAVISSFWNNFNF